MTDILSGDRAGSKRRGKVLVLPGSNRVGDGGLVESGQAARVGYFAGQAAKLNIPSNLGVMFPVNNV